jgi:hydantoinase/carbamoylase family amidase
MTTTNTRLPIDPAQIERDIVELARYTNPDVPFTRLAFTDLDKQARQVVSGWMEALGLSLRTDAAGNMIGLRKGGDQSAPALVIGSHVDTVYAGGRFDGIAGVVTALAIIRALNDAGITTRHPIEVINFTCEEPTVAGLTPFGSKAMAGVLDQSQISEAIGPDGSPLVEGINLLGGDGENIAKAQRDPAEIKAYLELHIEQGSVLEREGFRVGTVSAIATSARGRIIVEGRADHAGATMMDERQDALCAAAEIVLALEQAAKAPGLKDAVATVGILEVSPGFPNIIPGRVEMVVEARSVRQEEKEAVKATLMETINDVQLQRGVKIGVVWNSDELPVTVPDEMQNVIAESSGDLGIPIRVLPSRAAHDANALSLLAPIGMVFVPSLNGLSHCPNEWSSFEDIALGAEVLGTALLKLDAQ